MSRGSRNTTIFTVLTLVGVAAIAVLGIVTLWRQTTNRPETVTYLKSWGDNDKGQLGSGHLNVNSGSLVSKPGSVALKNEDVKAIYAGLRHSFALTTDGKVYAWGSNEYGQLGIGANGGSRVSPQLVKGLPKVVMLATKQDHTLALDQHGNVWAWGLNMSGQLGDSTNTNRNKPYKVPGLSNVTYIATGYRSAVAVKRNGSVWQWGGYCNVANRKDKNLAAYVSQLTLTGYNDGTGGTIEHITPADDCLNEDFINIKSYVPVQVTGIPKIKSLSVGYGHTLAVATDGTLWSWGCNMYGQVGNGRDGAIKAYVPPMQVTGIGRVAAVSAGFRHSLVLDTKGRVWSWGHRYFGEVGDGTVNVTSNVKRPYMIPSLKKVSSIAAGHDYSLAVSTNGKVFGWGQASFAQLGQQKDVAVGKPVSINKLTNVSNATAGGAHVLVMLERNE